MKNPIHITGKMRMGFLTGHIREVGHVSINGSEYSGNGAGIFFKHLECF